MASEAQATPEMQSSTLSSASNATFSIFIPFHWIGFTSADPGQNRPDPDQNPGSPDDNAGNNPTPEGQNPQEQRNRVILINPLTQGMVVIEGAGLSFNTLFRTPPEKEGPPPAAKSAIEAMPSVEIKEGDEGECAICLDGWFGSGSDDENGEIVVKEMPCKHRFHGGCIEKWLGMHGSCPVFRYAMPVEEKKVEREERAEEGGGERRREVWVTFSFGGVRRIGEETERGGDGTESNSDSGDQSGCQSDSGDQSGSDGRDGEQNEAQEGESGNVYGSNTGDQSGSLNSGDSDDQSGSMEDID